MNANKLHGAVSVTWRPGPNKLEKPIHSTFMTKLLKYTNLIMVKWWALLRNQCLVITVFLVHIFVLFSMIMGWKLRRNVSGGSVSQWSHLSLFRLPDFILSILSSNYVSLVMCIELCIPVKSCLTLVYTDNVIFLLYRCNELYQWTC